MNAVLPGVDRAVCGGGSLHAVSEAGDGAELRRVSGSASESSEGESSDGEARTLSASADVQALPGEDNGGLVLQAVPSCGNEKTPARAKRKARAKAKTGTHDPATGEAGSGADPGASDRSDANEGGARGDAREVGGVDVRESGDDSRRDMGGGDRGVECSLPEGAKDLVGGTKHAARRDDTHARAVVGPVGAEREVHCIPGDRVTGSGFEICFGRWERALCGVIADAMIFDAPYSRETHEGSAKGTRDDGSDSAGLAPTYGYLTEDDVFSFVAEWAPRCRGWMVSITDDVLAPVWKQAYKFADRVTFPAIPCVLRGMTHRMHGDGPDSWTVFAMVSRPRGREWIGSGSKPGVHIGGCGSDASGGRGKPEWLLRELVENYSKPGDLVVDPFAGWGSTLRAAAGLKRRGLGSEMDAECFTKAVANLRRPNQVDMFAGVI